MQHQQRSNKYVHMENFSGPKQLRAIDLFSGSGAVSEGLKENGFKVVAAVDNDTIACETYRLNHPEVSLLQKNIREINPAEMALTIDTAESIDLVVVCAPCQPFSNQNRKRIKSDPRANLIVESIKFVRQFQPTLVFFENVPGLATNGPIAELTCELEKLGYFLSRPIKLDAADMGVPQRRERCILIATKNKTVTDSFGNNITLQSKISVREAIGGLPSLKSGEASSTDPLHRARTHEHITLQRLKHIPQDGGSRSSLPNHLVLECHKNRDSDFPDVYGRLKWNDVAPTLTTGCTDLTKGRFAHPRDDRALTLREAALLQSFPLHYQFFGNSGQVARQIGNAVPVGMIRTLAPYLATAISEAKRNITG
jgi:DNA (cytosine-5)-methyltransferase 1